jgi:hypothetical protein
MLRQISAELPNVTAAISHDALCDAAGCKNYLNGEFLYRDENHIHRNLSGEIKRQLADLIGLPAALSRRSGTEASAARRD